MAMEKTNQAQQLIGSALGGYQKIVAKMESTNQDLLMVSSTVEEVSQTNQNGIERVSEIRQLGEEISDNMQRQFAHADSQRHTTNIALLHLARYRLQGGAIEKLVKIMLNRRAVLEQKLLEISNEGVDLFDRDYRPTPGSKMGKMDIRWYDAFKRKIQPLIDDWHQNPAAIDIIYWIPSDDRSYVPLNRSELSKPETGNLAVDAEQSRVKFFSVTDPVELKNIQNCKDVSMGTFIVPTGHTVIAIFTPLMLKGRRWGTFSLGALPSALDLD